MQTGDEFAKQFGPSDWFLLTITGEGTSGNVLGSVNFYLKAINGPIVNTWQSVGLSSLALARTLEFNLASSDTGPYGMNTPAYFAMDDLVLSPAASATSGNWVYAGGTTGSWKNGNNWSPATVPNGGTATVTFLDTSTAPTAVTLDGNQSIGGLVFNVSGTNGYTLSQGTGGVLTLGTSAGASISVVSGSHTISAPIVLAGSLAVSISGGGSLDISGSVSKAAGALAGLRLDGDGQLILSGTNSYRGGATISGGTLDVLNSASLPDGSALTVGSGAGLIFGQPPAMSPVILQDSAAGVPEPGVFALIAAGGVCCVAALVVRRRRVR